MQRAMPCLPDAPQRSGRPDPRRPRRHLATIAVHARALAHSNFPQLPPASSLEIHDTRTLQLIESISLGLRPGSLTWAVRHRGKWWACFAYYNDQGPMPGLDQRSSYFGEFDGRWQMLRSWLFPPAFIATWGDSSSSGGDWGDDGLLYATGHDARELHVLRLPQQGVRLEHVTTIEVPFEGQGWASPQSVRTGGYCRARSRLPLSMVLSLTCESGRLLSARASNGWRWRARHLKRLDGTGISMPDTPSNQAAFPQPACQAVGVGFPLARLCTVHCLASGAVLAAAVGPHRGAGHSELDLSRTLLAAFSPADVLLANALYGNYWFIADLLAAGVDVVLRQHGSRVTDFRRGRRLGHRDHVVLWEKPRVAASAPQLDEAGAQGIQTALFGAVILVEWVLWQIWPFPQ